MATLRTRRQHRRGGGRWRSDGACLPLESRCLLAAVPVVVDLMAVYTPAAAAQVGGDAHMVALIQGSVDSMNHAMINSAISVTVRLVHAEPIAYSSSGDVYADRVALETPGDGKMDGVFALRDTYKADLVTLIADGYGGGNADRLNDPAGDPSLAFSAVFASGIGPGFLTIAHELGHNLGARHERGNANEAGDLASVFPYSYGYRFSVASTNLNASYNDIMAYGYGMDIPLFQYSNPAVTFAGVPTGKPAGDPNAADLAMTFAQTAPVVAGYRAVALADTVAPTGSVFEVARNGSSLDVTVRYGDDSGLDLTTIGAGDITVSGPGGWALPAAYVSMDQPAVAGAYKFARYHVTLPATNPATSALSFTLLPGAVKDMYGRPAVGGVMGGYAGYYAGSPFEASGHYAAYAWAEPLSAGLTPGAAFTEYGELGPDDQAHYYSFTLASSGTVEINLSGFSADCNLYLTSDVNHNGLDDDASLTPDNGYNAGVGAAGAEDVGLTLAAGTYYIHVDQPTPAQTGYALAVREAAAGVDGVAPSAVAETRDVKAAGTMYADFAVTYTDDFDFNGVSARFDAAVDVHSVTYGYTYYLYPDGTLNDYYYAGAPSRTIYYRITAESGGFVAGDNDTFQLSVHDPGSGNPRPRDVAGNLVPIGAAGSLGSFRIAIGTADTVAPTGAFVASAPVPGQAAWAFGVLYKDNVGLNTNSFDGSDVRVTGPNGYSQLASFVSAAATSNIGAWSVATYSVTAPAGYWDGTDAGNYTVAVVASQVKDASNNAVAAGTLATVAFASPYVVAQASPVAVGFVGTSGNDLMRVDGDAGYVYLNFGDSLLYMVPKALTPRLAWLPGAGNDALYFGSGTVTAAIVPGGGSDTLYVTGGALTVDVDVTAAATLGVSVSGTGGLTVASTQHFSAVSVADAGVVAVSAGGGKVLVTKALAVAGGGTFNVSDDAVIVDYAGTSPVGGLRPLLQAGYAGGSWTGTGITSSAAAADGAHLHGVGYGEASAILGIAGAGTGTFQGQAVDATAVLLRYTYEGDTDLSGRVDGADLANLMAGLHGGLGGWVNGDVNYDGVVTVADQAMLMAGLRGQGAPLGAEAPGSGAEVGPESGGRAKKVARPKRGKVVKKGVKVKLGREGKGGGA